MKIASSIKVGLLTIIALFILVGTINWLKGRSVSQGERIEVQKSKQYIFQNKMILSL